MKNFDRKILENTISSLKKQLKDIKNNKKATEEKEKLNSEIKFWKKIYNEKFPDAEKIIYPVYKTDEPIETLEEFLKRKKEKYLAKLQKRKANYHFEKYNPKQ